jgi:hypothetical protein
MIINSFFFNWFSLCFPTHNGYISILLLMILLYILGYQYVYDNRHLGRYYILNIKYSDMLSLRGCHKGNFSFVINQRNYIINVN